MKDVKCPYCGHGQDINHDGYGYEEDRLHEQECCSCDRSFAYSTSISFYHEAYSAPCIDDESLHQWEPTFTTPRECTKMRCKACWYERPPTPEEMSVIMNRPQ